MEVGTTRSRASILCSYAVVHCYLHKDSNSNLSKVRLIIGFKKKLVCNKSLCHLLMLNFLDRKGVMSGVYPTGSIFRGNYFGAIKNWVALQIYNSQPLSFSYSRVLFWIGLPFMTIAIVKANLFCSLGSSCGSNINAI